MGPLGMRAPRFRARKASLSPRNEMISADRLCRAQRSDALVGQAQQAFYISSVCCPRTGGGSAAVRVRPSANIAVPTPRQAPAIGCSKEGTMPRESACGLSSASPIDRTGAGGNAGRLQRGEQIRGLCGPSRRFRLPCPMPRGWRDGLHWRRSGDHLPVRFVRHTCERLPLRFVERHQHDPAVGRLIGPRRHDVAVRRSHRSRRNASRQAYLRDRADQTDEKIMQAEDPSPRRARYAAASAMPRGRRGRRKCRR